MFNEDTVKAIRTDRAVIEARESDNELIEGKIITIELPQYDRHTGEPLEVEQKMVHLDNLLEEKRKLQKKLEAINIILTKIGEK